MKMKTKMKTMMKTTTASWLIVVIILIIGSGCIDSRIKRAASLVNVKTTVESKEFSDAKTSEEKLKIAENHFKTLSPLTQVLDDYMQGRKPQDGK